MKSFYVILIISLSACGIKPENNQKLYKDMLNVLPYKNAAEFKGDGKEAIPVFMSWAIFSYKADAGFVDYLISYSSFETKNEFNKMFHKEKLKDFPLDLSYWTKVSKTKIETQFDRSKCVAYSGVNFPYIHEILIDTTNYKVLHLVSGMRE